MDAGAANPENIVIVRNFISKSDLIKLYEYCYSINEWETWSAGGEDKISTAKTMKANNLGLHNTMKGYVNEIQKQIEFKFGRPLEPAEAGIRRWDAGEEQALHADGENRDGSPNNTYIVDYGSVIYINQNFVGGEIYFPQYDLEITPEAGMLVYFPSSKYYLHGVRKILQGIRYTSPHFWVPEKNRKLINGDFRK
jgi:hypothetical protein